MASILINYKKMKTKDNNNSPVIIAIMPVSLLGLMFVALKLTSVIDWPWIWVTLPFWIGPAILIISLLAVTMFFWFREIIRFVVK